MRATAVESDEQRGLVTDLALKWRTACLSSVWPKWLVGAQITRQVYTHSDSLKYLHGRFGRLLFVQQLKIAAVCTRPGLYATAEVGWSTKLETHAGRETTIHGKRRHAYRLAALYW